MASKDYYKILGVSPSISSEQISAAYYALVKKHHPDHHPGIEGGQERIREINEAYAVLSDPQKRREYDKSRRSTTPSPSSATHSAYAYSPSPRRKPPAPKRSPNVSPDSLSPFDVVITLPLTPEEARFGGPCRFTLRVSEPCRCVSAAAWKQDSPNNCKACHGSGHIEEEHMLCARIPPGVRDGDLLCMAGCGKPQPVTAARGDLYLKLTVRPCW